VRDGSTDNLKTEKIFWERPKSGSSEFWLDSGSVLEEVQKEGMRLGFYVDIARLYDSSLSGDYSLELALLLGGVYA
jgi:hypothetical protein